LQFPSTASASMRTRLASPEAAETFQRSKLNWAECETHVEALALHCDLLHLRRDDRVFAQQKLGSVDGAVLAHEAFVLRFCGEAGDDRLLIVNLGCDVFRRSIADPLVAPPHGQSWSLLWSSEDPKYGGSGITSIEIGPGWRIPGHTAVVLCAW
jgi:maltooligosyltrehalose trehalohydrolase